MATSSITKKFVIKDNKTCDKLIKILAENPPRKRNISVNKYEEGKKTISTVSVSLKDLIKIYPYDQLQEKLDHYRNDWKKFNLLMVI